jgi:hypothetical protein
MDEEYHPSKEVWKFILCLANRWTFDGIQSLAIKKLGELPLGLVEKVDLCRQFDIEDSWVSKALTGICARNKPLSLVEAHHIGLGNSLFIANEWEKRI